MANHYPHLARSSRSYLIELLLSLRHGGVSQRDSPRDSIPGSKGGGSTSDQRGEYGRMLDSAKEPETTLKAFYRRIINRLWLTAIL
jgi:hypothetical protein